MIQASDLLQGEGRSASTVMAFEGGDGRGFHDWTAEEFTKERRW